MNIVTMGEVLLRLTPDELLKNASGFSACFGGGEANAAVALCGFGHSVRHLTAFPKNDIGRAACAELSRYGVDTRFVKFGKGRMGLYFYEKGCSLRAGKVIYDRADSAFSLCGEYDLAGAFEGADLFHISGITPALGARPRAIMMRALEEARRRGVEVSFDVNFRPSLWEREEAEKAFREILPYADHCIVSSDGLDVLGRENAGHDLAACERAARSLWEEYGFKTVALTVRESCTASRNRLSGALLSGGWYLSDVFDVEIADRVGGGDAFAAGLIHALLSGFGGKETISFAAACYACKHTLLGDKMCMPEEEIKAIMRGDTRLRR